MGDLASFGSRDAAWLKFALRLELRVDNSRFRAPHRDRGDSISRLRPKHVLSLAEQIEAAGALSLASNILTSARRLWDRADTHASCLAIAQQARIARTLGDFRRATQLYAALVTAARRHGFPELEGRALVGRGVVFGMNGQLAAATRSFAMARRVVRTSPAIVAASYHGELAAALAETDLSRAVLAGNAALQEPSLPGQDRAAILINVAAIALRLRRPRAAWFVLHEAMKASRHPRIRLHALGKLALCAGQLRDLPELRRIVQRAMIAATRVVAESELLEARSEIAVAWQSAGDLVRAHRLATSVRQRAVALRLPIIIARCERVLQSKTSRRPRVRLAARAAAVLTRLERMNSSEVRAL